jgi:hypothetical protein
MTTTADAQRTWNNGGSLKGPVIEAYYAWRGLAVPETQNLRFIAALGHRTGVSYPAILARAEDVNGELTGIQRTFLAHDGAGKAPVDKKLQKMSVGRIKGSMVRLAEPVDDAPLLIGEGVETTLTVMQATGYPGYASLGTSGLKATDLPSDSKDVVLLGENDGGKNAKAIAKAASDLTLEGVRVRVAMPLEGFKDLNDMVMGAADRAAAFEAVSKAVEDAEEWVDDDKSEEATTQAAKLARLAIARCDAFIHDETREAYAILPAPHEGGTHREVHKLKTKSFREWLLLAYFELTGAAPNDNSIRSAIALLGAIARHRGEQHEVFVRRAFYKGKRYVDLCDDRWRAAEIDEDGWRIVDESPALFIRAPGMLPLPEPIRGDPKLGIARLRKLMRSRTDSDFVIVVACLQDALGGRGPHAVLFFTGEAGSTKTTHCKMVRALTDPNSRPVRGKPKELRDVFIAATKSGMVIYNNLSSLQDWLSDVLCVITEGSSDSRRELFTDDDESAIFARAPVVLAAVNNIVTQGDLGARTLYAGLAPVPDSERRTEPEFWQEFNEAAPEILGALLTSLSVGLRRLPTIRANLPRMATFAQLAMACETAFWPQGTFAAAYEVNARNAVADALDANIAVSTFRDFMEGCPDGKWKGTALQLHAVLTDPIRKPEHDANEAYQKAVAARNQDLQVLTKAKLREAQQTVRDVIASGWPKEPNILSHELRKAGPQLRKIGIAITWPSSNRDRSIWVEMWMSTETPSQPSQRSQTKSLGNENNDLSGRMPGRSRSKREDDFDPGADSDDGAVSQNGEDQREGWEDPGKIIEQTENADSKLKQQGYSTRVEDVEGREDVSVDIHTRVQNENLSEFENPKNEAKPAKRTIPL